MTTSDGQQATTPALNGGGGVPKSPPPAPGTTPPPDDGSSSNPLDLLNGRVGGAVLAVVSFWIVALLLPDSATPVSAGIVYAVTLILGSIGVLLPIVLLIATRRMGSPERVEVVGAFSLFLFFVVLTSVWWVASSKIISFSAPMKVAFGVGGSALGALAIGLLLFRTLRVAASLPVVVLFIGLVAFPGSKDMVGELGDTLVAWMGAILGASALAEGATQVTQTVQRGGVSKAVAQSSAAQDPESARTLRTALLPEPNGRLPGDLR